MKSNKIILLFSTLFVIVHFNACTSICNTDPILKNINGSQINLPSSKIPCYKEDDYNLAARLTIEALFSEEFKDQLELFMSTKIESGKHVQAWNGLTVDGIVNAMKSTINGTFATTYGNLNGFIKYKFVGNIAYDGTENGPIRLNRWPLKHRTVPQIANTIAHEVAHRAGYIHPNSSVSLRIADLEPPYVIGNIVEDVVESILLSSTN